MSAPIVSEAIAAINTIAAARSFADFASGCRCGDREIDGRFNRCI